MTIQAAWATLRSAPAAAEEIVRRYQRAYVQARADGAADIHVGRRRREASSDAWRSLAEVEAEVRKAAGLLHANLQDVIGGRRWAAEDAERDQWAWNEEGEREVRPGRWPPIRERLEEAREPEAVIRVIEQIANEFRRSDDEEGFAILTHQVPGYLEFRRRWPTGRIESAMAAIEAAELAASGQQSPEVQARELYRLEHEALEAIAEAREAAS